MPPVQLETAISATYRARYRAKDLVLRFVQEEDLCVEFLRNEPVFDRLPGAFFRPFL